MFGIGWAELLIIAVVATVVVPPRDLPRLMRGFGHSVRKAQARGRRLAAPVRADDAGG